MPKTDPEDWVNESELRAATGIDRYSLRRVRRWLFIEHAREFRGRGTGSETYYPAIAVPMIRRFLELRRKTRKIDECVWRLWLEGFPIDICAWADARLARLQTALELVENPEGLDKTISTISLSSPRRADARRSIFGRLRHWEEISLLHWAIDVAAGRVPAKSLYDPASPALDALNKASGLGANREAPNPELAIESLSLPHLRDILRTAGTAELEQARRDWTTIAQLVEASEAVDWSVTRKTLNVQRTSSVQPLPPADFLLGLWRNFDARAAILAGLIHLRGSPDHSQRMSEVLAVAGWALRQLPRRSVKGTRRTSVASATEIRSISDARVATAEPRT